MALLKAIKEVAGDLFASYKDSGGRYRTLSLFKEHELDSYPAYFTLKDRDSGKYISMYRKYMEIEDPTEYLVAIRLLGSWNHWQVLCRANWFLKHVELWRAELKVKMDSDRYAEMLKNVDDPKTTVQATKWLSDRYGTKPEKAVRGRPSDAEKKAALNNELQSVADLQQDAERLGLPT